MITISSPQPTLYVQQAVRNTQKVPGSSFAVGAWSSAYRRLECGQEATKVRALLEDKLIARGRWASLWIPVTPQTPGVVACTCVKQTVEAAERMCLSCHGTKYAPGFQKFLHFTTYWASAEAASFTLTNTFLDTATKKAHLVALTGTSTTGTIVTQAKAYTNPNLEAWSLKLEAYRRATNNTITLEYSLNNGATWTPVALTEYVSPVLTTPNMSYGYVGSIAGAALGSSGSIRFRITLARASTNDLSPLFEILRLRRVRTEHMNPRLYLERKDGAPGQMLVLRPQVMEQDTLDPMRGRIVDHLSDKAWTAPLDLFDTSIVRDTPAASVNEYIGSHAFYSFTSGVQALTMYVITKHTWNDGMGLFTQQWFDDRRATEGEPYWLVW